MEKCSDLHSWKLLTVIVDLGQGSRVLRHARQQGVSGGTIILGESKERSRFAEWMDYHDSRKEIILMLAGEETADHTLEILSTEFTKGHTTHARAFLISVTDLFGSQHCSRDSSNEHKGGIPVMHKTIIAIVDKGMAESVVNAAEKAGSHGATIVNARGAGVYETARLFNMDIEPEKELVLILAKTEECEAVTQAIRSDAHLDEAGKGIMFVLDIQNSWGITD